MNKRKWRVTKFITVMLVFAMMGQTIGLAKTNNEVKVTEQEVYVYQRIANIYDEQGIVALKELMHTNVLNSG